MATTAEGRRRRKNRSKKNRRDAGAATTVLDLPDHLFEHILLRLGPSPCLVRAAAACRRWCLVVADAGFLARVRCAHPHAMRVGDYHNHNISCADEPPVFVPAPTSPAAPLAVDVRHFDLDFLTNLGEDFFWEIADSRGSLLLLSAWTYHYCQLLVCEPLTRRHQEILLPPGFRFGLGNFLVDGDDADSQLGMSNFRIIATVDESLVCVYSPGVYSPGSDDGWRLVCSVATIEANLPLLFDDGNFVGRGNGSIYWGIAEGDGTEVLSLNETTAEYSMVKFPEEIWGSYVRWKCCSWIIGGEDGVLRIVRLEGKNLKIFAQRHSCSKDKNSWIMEKELVGLAEATVGLPGREESFFEQGTRIVAANAEYILLTPMLAPTWLFSVELDTMRVEREHERNKYAGASYPCELPWPPVLPDITREGQVGATNQ